MGYSACIPIKIIWGAFPIFIAKFVMDLPINPFIYYTKVMESKPYSVYYYKRPLRIAFLINPVEENGWIDRIFHYNRDKWGGRCMPIVHTNGMSFTPTWWNFLQGYDPDIIYSIVPLCPELKIRISKEIYPISIEEQRPDTVQIYLNSTPITIFPSNSNVSAVSFGFGFTDTHLTLFEVDTNAPDPIYSFLDRNFWILNNNSETPYPIKRSFQDCQHQTFKVSDFESLNNTLIALSDHSKRFVFPSQICSIPNDHKDVQSYPRTDHFSVVAGNSIDDLSFFWNRPLSINKWLRQKFTTLWLPEEFIDNSTIKPGLKQFIGRYSMLLGSSCNPIVKYFSFSCTINDLDKLSSSNTEGPAVHCNIEKLEISPNPQYDRYEERYFVKQGSHHHWAHSNVEQISLIEPDVDDASNANNCWIADLYIQYKPERFIHIIGRNYWWHLPKINNLLYNMSIIDKPARVNAQGSLSILLNLKSEQMPYGNIIKIKIPEDKEVFHALLCGERLNRSQDNAGNVIFSRPFYFCKTSDAGRHFQGVLGLFQDITNAHTIFGSNYWRNLFEHMSNRIKNKEDLRFKAVQDKLRKHISKGRDFNNCDDDLSWLAETIIIEANQIGRQEIEMQFQEISKMAKMETDAYNETNPGNKFEFDVKELKDTLHSLLYSKVMLLGMKPVCPRCGYRIWVHIDDMHQIVICKGCGYEFTIKPEEPQYYRLNKLVGLGVSRYGILPLILVLGQLLFESNTSFIFVPSLELYEQFHGHPRDAKPKYEIDLLCINDGKFIIGELKDRVKKFNEADFIKIAEVTRRIRPDKVIFSSLDEEPNGFVTDKIHELKEEFAADGIEVCWFKIDQSAFTPYPVR